MRPSVSNISWLLLLFIALAVTALAQAPTGALRGSVTDPSSAVVSGAEVTVKNKQTGAERSATTKADGEFLLNNLEPGEYEVKVLLKGFKASLSSVTIQVGDTANTEIALEVGETSETVVISGDSTSVVNTNDFKIDGVITRQKIDNLPLNGRNYLTLAALEPGVRVSTSNPGDANSLVNVSIGGAPSGLTRLTVDGGSIVDAVTGGAGQNFSIESVQEFQISSFNFDLATGVTSVGAINIITRSGGNELHGNAFAFYRDRNIAAYPVLKRDPLNPDPFFRRLQSGFSIGGPIVKDKAHWFFNLEDLNQDAVFSTINTGYRIPGTNVFPFSQFDTITPSPFNQLLTNAKVTYNLNDKNNFFVGYSGDVSDAFAPVESNVLPSNWRVNKNNAYRGQGGWTWVPRASLTNDLRFNWTYGGNKSLIPTAQDCPNCLGIGGPQIRVNGSSFRAGNQVSAPQGRALHRYETTDNASWSKGRHLVQFGGTWEKDFGVGHWNFLEPALVVVHNPADILAVNGAIDLLANPNTPGLGPLLAPIFGPVAPLLRIPLPSAFTTPGARITLQDILNLPLAAGIAGLGDGGQPPSFNADIARRSARYRLYGQDTFRIRPNFTLKYGLSYTYEDNLYNHDQGKPSLLSPLYGTTEANKTDKDNFAPALGFAWDVRNNAKTVIRGGASMFYDTSLFVNRLTERALIGPLGDGRVVTTNNFYVNTLQFSPLPQSFINTIIQPNGQPGPLITNLTALRNSLPAGSDRDQLSTLLNLIPGLLLINPPTGAQITDRSIQTVPTRLTAQQFLNLLNQQTPGIRSELTRLGGQGVRGLDFFKSASGTGVLIDPVAKLPYSLQFSIGVQRELPGNMLLTADFVARNRVHTFFQRDRNLFNRAASLGGPIIRQCTPAEATNPTVRCSNGPVEVLEASGREQYKALLLKLDKRFSRRFAFTASYALSSLKGFDYTRDLTNPFGTPGPLGNDARHIFAFNSVIDLPWSFRASVIANFNSRSPFSLVLNGLAVDTDVDGDGTGNDLLPGFGFNQGNRDISESDLRALVDDYNQNLAGRTTPRGGTLPRVTLPASFDFGDIFQSYDLRLSRDFKFTEQIALELIGEVFNLFNISNLGGFSGRLDADFGQPTGRAGQAFGYGGPRAFQFGAKFKF